MTVYTDAATTKGLHCGGYCVETGRWFMEKWEPWQIRDCHINFLEMAAMVFAVYLWKRDFEGTSVKIWTDNKPAMFWMSN